MPDANAVAMTPGELFDLAIQCAADPASVNRSWKGVNQYNWEWLVDGSAPNKCNVLAISVTVEPDRVATERTTGRTWIRPHLLWLRYYLFDSENRQQEIQFEFLPSLLGIEPDGKPRPALAALISRQPLLTEA